MLERVDDLVCEGGPTALLIGLSLAHMGISTAVVDKSERRSVGDVDPKFYRKMLEARAGKVWQACCKHERWKYVIKWMYLRLLSLWPRLLTFLAVMLTIMLETVISGSYHSAFNRLHGTYFDYVINIRQRYSEEIFRKSFEDNGGKFYEIYELVSIIHRVSCV
jgi:phenol 2-monooxygenase